MIIFRFSWAPDLSMLLSWFLDVTLHRKCNMTDEYITKMDGNVWSENVPQKCTTSIKNT